MSLYIVMYITGVEEEMFTKILSPHLQKNTTKQPETYEDKVKKDIVMRNVSSTLSG